MKGNYFVSQEEYQKTLKELEDAKKAYEETRAANTRLTEDLGLTKKELEDLKKKSPKADINELQKKLAIAQEEATKVKAESAESQKKLNALQDEVAKAKAESAESQKKLNALQDEVAKAKAESAESQKKLAIAQAEAAAAKEEAKKAKSGGGSARLKRLLNSQARVSEARPYIEAIRNNRRDLLELLEKWESQDSEEDDFLDGII